MSKFSVNPKQNPAETLVTHTGGCHCEAISFEVTAPALLKAIHCNCSICQMCGFLHLIIKKQHFKLLQGQENLSNYRFNTKTAQHLFCKTCGIKSFYIPRSHPDSYSINVNCLNKQTIENIEIQHFDGQNWEAAIATLPRKNHRLDKEE